MYWLESRGRCFLNCHAGAPVKCPVCLGAALVPNQSRGGSLMVTCPNCKGKGSIDEPRESFKIAIVGEAWGESEEQTGLPFVGAAGTKLNELLEEAEIDRKDCFLTNVFNLRPKPTLDVKNLGTTKALSTVPMPAMSSNVYLQDRYWPEVLRLYGELERVRPNITIAMGNTPLWALTGNFGIKSLRGTVTSASRGAPQTSGLKVIPTYHPSYVLRDPSVYAIVVADLIKAKRESTFPEIRRPKRELWIEPSINHIKLFYETYIARARPFKMAFDIETAGADQITCVGFSPSPERALVIPFVDNRKDNGSFWPTAELEIEAWGWVRRFLEHPEVPEIQLVGQNTLYDINWLWTKLGYTPKNYVRDTMLKHHALNPEMEKGLGFLGSIYTDEPAWKTMRGKGLFTIKRGE